MLRGKQPLVCQSERCGSPHIFYPKTLFLPSPGPTGKHFPSVNVPASDREKRLSTSEATAAASEKKGPTRCKGIRVKGETKKSLKAKTLNMALFDIGLAEIQQPKEALAFYVDQKTERKSLLPPVIGELGVERRRRQREEKEEKKRKDEEEEAKTRFATVG